MSLPLQSAGAVLGAAVLAQKAVRQIGQAIGFDAVLRSPDGGDATVLSVQEATEKLTTAIRDRLSEMGLDANLIGSVNVQPSGQIQIMGSPPGSAEIGSAEIGSAEIGAADIEARLSQDVDIQELIRQLMTAAGPAPQSIDLTNGRAQGNILELFGG